MLNWLKEFWNGLQPASLAQWIAAFATSAAVLIALFRETFLQWWRQPSLEVEPIEPPHCHKLPVDYQTYQTALVIGTTFGYFFRLRIKNNGRTRANQVEVYAARLYRRALNGTFKEDSTFLPMNLLWSHYPEESHVVYAEGISPRMGKHCDLGYIIRPKEKAIWKHDLSGVAPDATVFALALEVKPSSRSHLLEPGTYRLELNIAASNSKPVTKILEFTHEKWFDDADEMFRKGIGLKFIE